MMKAIVDQNIPYVHGVLDPFFDVRYMPGIDISADDVRDADALIIRTRTRCNAQLLRGSKLSFIGSATIGIDHVDTQLLSNQGIAFANAPGCNAAAVQQWVMSAIVLWATTRNVDLAGLTLGVVGVGNVGGKVATSAKALGLQVLCCDPPRQRNEQLSHFVSLEQLIAKSQIVTFHVPLSRTGMDATYHIVNEEVMRAFNPNSLIINTSRGEVFDTDQVFTVMKERNDIDLAFDVFENEPLIFRPLVAKTLVSTPHIAGYSIEGKVNGAQMVIDALSKHFGLKLHPWHPEPNPSDNKMLIPNNLDLQQAINFSYHVMDDDVRRSGCHFERLRDNYAYRHDFSGYRVSPANPIADKLRVLGFG